MAAHVRAAICDLSPNEIWMVQQQQRKSHVTCHTSREWADKGARHTEGVDSVCAVERNSNLQRRSSGLLLLLLLLLALTKKPTTAATAGAAKKSMKVLMSGEICVESRKAIRD